MAINPTLKTGIAWGTASEFDKKNERERVITDLTGQFGKDRLTALPLNGQTHAMNLDPLLNSTIIAQILNEQASITNS